MFKNISKTNSYLHFAIVCVCTFGLIAFSSAWFWNRPLTASHDSANTSERTVRNDAWTNHKGDWVPDIPQPTRCGNEVLDEWEQCDDGNTIDWDWCSSICEEERYECYDLDAALDLNNDGVFDEDDVMFAWDIILWLVDWCDPRNIDECEYCEVDSSWFNACNPINWRVEFGGGCKEAWPWLMTSDQEMMIRYYNGEISASQYLKCSTHSPCEDDVCVEPDVNIILDVDQNWQTNLVDQLLITSAVLCSNESQEAISECFRTNLEQFNRWDLNYLEEFADWDNDWIIDNIDSDWDNDWIVNREDGDYDFITLCWDWQCDYNCDERISIYELLALTRYINWSYSEQEVIDIFYDSSCVEFCETTEVCGNMIVEWDEVCDEWLEGWIYLNWSCEYICTAECTQWPVLSCA